MTEQLQETSVSKPKKEFTKPLTIDEIKAQNKEQRKRYINFLRDKDRELVRGKFIFHEVPGGRMQFSFMKWPGDPVEHYDMVDGQIYSIPLGVAKHLNKECKYPIHGFQMDENNKPSQVTNRWVRRVSFQSLEFIDAEDLTPVGTGNK